MSMSAVAAFAEVDSEIKGLEAKLKSLKARRGLLEEILLDFFAENAVSHINVGGKTVFTHRQIWAKPLYSREAVASALRESGYETMVTEGFNSNTLSAMLREREEAGEPVIPPELEGIIDFSEVYSIRARKS